ncbi:MAG: hypothetical protein MJ168_04110 [Clostridia bacterium]|nr:hypothetical protein [Clostridia bacterium]
MEYNFAVAGCDEKMKSCKQRLNELGFGADCLDSEQIKDTIRRYRNIVLPLPTLSNGCIAGVPFDEFCGLLDNEQTVFCGNTAPEKFPCRAFSYYSDEGFLIKNSRLTAQGVLKIVLDNIRTDLHTMNTAVIGYGRCGREICRIMKRNGADVTSFSRRMQTFAAAENDGMKTDSIGNINKKLCKYDVIINTVPFNIIEKSGLECLTQRNMYIEVASRPYGFNISGTDTFNFRYVLAESLPGRFTPVSAGMNIADTVAGILREEKSNE